MPFYIRGVCKCGGELWRWEIKGSKLMLTCSKCGIKAEFHVATPVFDVFNQMKKL